MTAGNIAVVAVTDFFALYYPLVETSRAVSSIAAPRVTITDAKDDAVGVVGCAPASVDRWLRYWPAYTLLLLFESFVEWAISWFPLYSYLKLWLILWPLENSSM